MAHSDWCGCCCSECDITSNCPIDSTIPCSPDCKNLLGDKINIKGCLEAKCEEVFYIFDMEHLLNETKEWNTEAASILIEEYGEIANYPY